MTNTKPNPSADAQRVDTTPLIMRRLKVSQREAERLAALKPGKVDSRLDFAALYLLNLDGGEPERDDMVDEKGYAFACSVVSERASNAAKKPRPNRQHPRRAEFIRKGLHLMDGREGMTAERAALEILSTCDKATGEELPHADTVRKWLRQEIARR
ncbi:hypothetical protein [Ruegeria arenilitoris]|uniref:hypothetical protein n=1 Tax=Ruegeria arenilitoris TaxID=1173585 RepID=UPI001479841C|nr:hypothetical protein [Ruegeria arenilitoris]